MRARTRIRLKPLEALIISMSLLGEITSLGSIGYNSVNCINSNKQVEEIKRRNLQPDLISEDKEKQDKYNQSLLQIQNLRTKSSNYFVYAIASAGTAIASGIFFYQGIVRRRNRLLKHHPIL